MISSALEVLNRSYKLFVFINGDDDDDDVYLLTQNSVKW